MHMPTTKSPLRYPGGKTRAINIITQYFPKELKEICSPFFGGGSIELFLAGRGIKVHGYDAFKSLVEFWQCLIKHPCALAHKVQTYYPLSKTRFYHLQSCQTKFKTKLERAAVYYALNRSSFSGTTMSGGMSPNHLRFTTSSIKRVKEFCNSNFSVKHLDFKESIALHKNMFLYLDPPYLIKNNLYGRNGSAHKKFDHIGLFNILSKRDYWVLSYNDCNEIRRLYAGYKIITLDWKYGMSKNKSSKEVLIFSNDINIQN